MRGCQNCGPVWGPLNTEKNTGDFKKLEYGFGVIYAGYPSSLGLRVGGQSHSNFRASIAMVFISILVY